MPTPRDEMDALLDALIRFARQTLERYGEFYPFAAAVSPAGDVEMVGGSIGEEHPESQALLARLESGLRQKASTQQIRASRICLDVRLPEHTPGDAIQVRLEHADAEPVNVFLPYEQSPGGVTYGELFANRGERVIFA